MRYILALVIILGLVFMGCQPDTKPNTKTGRKGMSLPKGATEVQSIGANWATFKWRGGRYLFYKDTTYVHASAYHSCAAITQIYHDDEIKEEVVE